MERTPCARRLTRQAQSLPACLRQFLTASVWKQAQRGHRKLRKDARWNFHHLMLVLVAMTWSVGDSTPERFEMARGIVAICRPKRRRAGQTAQGFHKALVRLPMRPLVALAAAVRHRLLVLLGADLERDGFIPLGCDGSRLECPRNDELLARMGKAGKDDSAPSLWVTAVVHLTTGVPWSWWLGKGNASERYHLLRLLPTLPKRALIVADAGYNGYDLAAAIMASGASFLIRMSSKVDLIVDRPTDPSQFEQGMVKYWPHHAKKRKLPPQRLRLIKVRGRRKVNGKRRKVDVWLLTMWTRAGCRLPKRPRSTDSGGKMRACFAPTSGPCRRFVWWAALCGRCIERRMVRCWPANCCWPKGRGRSNCIARRRPRCCRRAVLGKQSSWYATN